MFEQIGMNDEQKQVVRSMHIELAEYVEEYITYGSVDFQNLAPVNNAICNVRNPNHEPTQDDVRCLWKVIQKAQRTHCGPKLPKEDRICIYTLWKSLDAFHRGLADHLSARLSAEQKATDKGDEKTGDSKTSENGDEETGELFNLEDQVDYGGEENEENDSQVSSSSSNSSSEESIDSEENSGDSEDSDLIANMMDIIVHTINSPQYEESDDGHNDVNDKVEESDDIHNDVDVKVEESDDGHNDVDVKVEEENESEQTHRYFENIDSRWEP